MKKLGVIPDNTQNDNQNPEGYDRFLTSMMRLAYGEKHGEMVLGLLQKEPVSQGIGRAIYFAAEATERALERQGVEVPSEEKAVAMKEMAKQFAVLASSNGVPVQPDDVKAGFQAGINLFMGERAKRGELDLTGSGNDDLDEVFRRQGLDGQAQTEPEEVPTEAAAAPTEAIAAPTGGLMG